MSNLKSIAMQNKPASLAIEDLPVFYYRSKCGSLLLATSNEFFARKQFKKKRQEPVVLGKLAEKVIRKFKPKSWA
jgi:hypothetical protein